MSNTSKIIKIIVLAVVVLLLCGVFFAAQFVYSKGGKPVSEVYSGDFAINDVESIDVSWRLGKVIVKPSPDQSIHVTESSAYDIPDEQLVQTNLTNKGLTIRQRIKFPILTFIFNFKTTDLELYVPESRLKALSVHTSSGQLDISGISADKIGLKASSGKITVQNIDCNDLESRISSGNFQADNLKVSGEMSLWVASGSSRVNRTIVGSALFHSTSGSIVTEDFTAQNVNCDVTSGRISLYGSFKNIISDSSSGSTTIKSSVLPDTANVESTSGSIKLFLPESSDGFTLDYKLTSGSFKSDFDFGFDYRGNKSGRLTYQNGKGNYTAKITSGSLGIYKY